MTRDPPKGCKRLQITKAKAKSRFLAFPTVPLLFYPCPHFPPLSHKHKQQQICCLVLLKKMGETRHYHRLVELLITRPGLFEAPSALLCNQCLLPQAVSKSQFKTKSKTCQPAFCLCGYSIQQISLREARTLLSSLTYIR